MNSPNIEIAENAQQQTLNSIQTLQKLEKSLYADLEKLSAENASVDAQQQIINRINDISQTRITLFKQLQSMYLTIQDNVSNTREDLVDQLTLVSIVEKELDNAKSQMNAVKNSNANNLRMTQINTYYSKRYKAHSEIMKIIVYLCVPLLILGLLSKKNLVPSYITNILSAIVIVYGLYLILPKLIDLRYRNNMVYDEYDFDFDPAKAPKASGKSSSDSSSLMDFRTCIGPNCCSDGMTYNDDLGLCVITNPHEKQSTIAGQSTQTPGTDLKESFITRQSLLTNHRH